MKYVQVKEFNSKNSGEIDKQINDWLKKHKFTADMVLDIKYDVDNGWHYALVILKIEQ